MSNSVKESQHLCLQLKLKLQLRHISPLTVEICAGQQWDRKRQALKCMLHFAVLLNYRKQCGEPPGSWGLRGGPTSPEAGRRAPSVNSSAERIQGSLTDLFPRPSENSDISCIIQRCYSSKLLCWYGLALFSLGLKKDPNSSPHLGIKSFLRDTEFTENSSKMCMGNLAWATLFAF